MSNDHLTYCVKPTADLLEELLQVAGKDYTVGSDGPIVKLSLGEAESLTNDLLILA